MAEQQKAPAKQAAKNELVTITFTKPWSRYSRGDIAGFDAAEAERLVKGIKVAVAGDKLPVKTEPANETAQ